MVEFGSGRSTIGFSTRVNKLTSVESDKLWFETTSNEIKSSENVELIYITKRDEYNSFINELADQSLDLVLIDGIYRDICANGIINKMKSGGIIIIDNANRYLYNKNTHSPDSLKGHDEMSSEWSSFYSRTKKLRRIWTTSGVSDTLLLFL